MKRYRFIYTICVLLVFINISCSDKLGKAKSLVKRNSKPKYIRAVKENDKYE